MSDEDRELENRREYSRQVEIRDEYIREQNKLEDQRWAQGQFDRQQAQASEYLAQEKWYAALYAMDPGAAEAYRKSMEAFRRNEGLRDLNRALSELRAGRYKDAVPIFKNAIRMMPLNEFPRERQVAYVG